MSKMFVVREGGQWDNPRIVFVTADEEIAKAVVEFKDRQQYDKQKKFHKHFVDSQKAKYNMTKLLVEASDAKEKLGEEAYNDLLDELERLPQSYTWAEKSLDESFQDWKKRAGRDWYYEQVPKIDTLDLAMALDKVQSEF